MVSLDQIQLLEHKIEIAVGKIVRITEENLSLHRELQRLKTEHESLQGIITKSQDEQVQIEQGILSIIDRLEAIETTVLETVVQKAEQVPDQESAAVSENSVAPPLWGEGSPPAELSDEGEQEVPSAEDEPEELSGEDETVSEAVFEPKPFVEDPVVEIDDFDIAPVIKPDAGNAFQFNSENDNNGNESDQLEIF
jgi:chromosome segregation ATPase